MGDGTELKGWIGRTETAEDVVAIGPVRALAATLDLGPQDADAAGLLPGARLPPLWHWLSFLPDTPMSGLGADGHPLKGGFLPPVLLERRMWAGGRLLFHDPIRIGEPIRRRSEVTAVVEKAGKAGPMVFVSVAHEISTPRGLGVREEQHIVYMAMPDRFVPPPPVSPPARAWAETVRVDEVRLFRFSAATFNAHRIHYDRSYAREVEKYPGLVVHGPLQAILLMQAARRHHEEVWPARFAFRGLRPAFHFEPLWLIGGAEAGGVQELVTATPQDAVCMRAEIGWT